jgi:1,4-alpha-glucan branching enzyme
MATKEGASQSFGSADDGHHTAAVGAFTFVLHSHLPYCRKAGQWPHGEEWIHEAAAETYVPLLDALYDLREEGVRFKLTINLTPVLVEQLADVDIQQHFLLYLAQEMDGAKEDLARCQKMGETELAALATYYYDFYAGIERSFLERYGGDLIGAFRRLQDEGYIEVITCPATHGYLPLMERDSSIYGQLRTAVESYRRYFGRSPRAVWLSECAYRPAYINERGELRPALEQFLAALGLTCFFAETHAVEGGQPVGKAAGEVAIGPYGAVRRHYVIPAAEAERSHGTTYSAYYVVGSQAGLTDPPVAVIGRNNRTGQQVWSADWGYPGDADYREFHRKDPHSGMQYWRVTGPKVELSQKDVYHPEWAAAKVRSHARHYADLVEELLQAYHAGSDRYGIIASNYDTELFGHWWFEGVEWIKQVLRHLAANPAVDLTTASEYVFRYEPDEVMAVPESSWGAGGNHWTWDNEDTHEMWAPIHPRAPHGALVIAMAPPTRLPSRCQPGGPRAAVCRNPATVPFMVTTGQAREYAMQRFQSHVERFNKLADMAMASVEDAVVAYARELYEADKVFAQIDYRWFAARQGRAD